MVKVKKSNYKFNNLNIFREDKNDQDGQKGQGVLKLESMFST